MKAAVFRELGQRMAMRGDEKVDSVIELIWQGQRYNLQRVVTSTGANRFEDTAGVDDMARLYESMAAFDFSPGRVKK